MIPCLRIETLENQTLSGGPYLSSLNIKANPSPRGYIVHNNSLRTHQSQTEGSACWSQPHPPWKVKYGSDVGNKQSRQKMWLSKHFSIEYRLIVACTVTLRFHVISHGWPPKQANPYVTIILTVRSLRTRKGEKTTTPDLSPFPHQFSKNRTVALWCLRRKRQWSKVLGRLLFNLFFFLPPLAPGPMFSKTLIFVHVIVLLYPNIE